MGEQDIPPQITGPLERARRLEPMFAVPSGVLDRIASATAPIKKPGVADALREVVLRLVEASAGGLKPAFRSGANPAHAARKITYAAGGLRLTLMLEPAAPGLPSGLPSDYQVLGRLTSHEGGSLAAASGAVMRVAQLPDKSHSSSGRLDEHGFFELTLPPGKYRLEIALDELRVVVPQLDVGIAEGS